MPPRKTTRTKGSSKSGKKPSSKKNIDNKSQTVGNENRVRRSDVLDDGGGKGDGNKRVEKEMTGVLTPGSMSIAHPNMHGISRQLTTFSTTTGVVHNTQSNTIVGEVEVTTTETTGSLTNSCADWYETLRIKGRMGDETMLEIDLVSYVRGELFPKLKFIMDPRQLTFNTNTNSICYQICHDMGLKKHRYAKWWELYKIKIVQILNCKRADVTAAIKRIFMSKLVCATFVELIIVILTGLCCLTVSM